MLHCSSLSKLEETADRIGARYMITLINEGTPVPQPASITSENWLFLGFNDIVTPIEGLKPPGQEHVEKLLGFVDQWPKDAPLLIHCWAGISRSTAATFITACHLRPDLEENALAARLRWAAPSATPNRRLVELADAHLGRGGRMVEAIERIGRGADAFEGTPFEFDLD